MLSHQLEISMSGYSHTGKHRCIVFDINNCPTLPNNMKRFWQNVPPQTEPILQWTSAILGIVWGMSLQPHAIIDVDWPTTAMTTLLNICLHDVNQKIVNTGTSHKYLLALPDLVVVQSTMQNAPYFFIISNVHLTSFVMLSKFKEKHPSTLPWSTCV